MQWHFDIRRMENITKRQHYVPQFYLRKFVDENGELHCYNIKSNKWFRAHPKDICFKDFGYETRSTSINREILAPNEIEKMFRSLENEYSPVLTRIIRKCELNSSGQGLICTSTEKEVLASMISNFLARNFHAVDSFTDQEVARALIDSNDEIGAIDALLREMKMGDAMPLIELAQKRIFLSPNENGVAQSIIENLLKMNVSFFVSDRIRFITSDCPVGYNCNSDEFFMVRMPLSPYVTVVYSNSEISKQFRNRARLIEERFVKILNRDYMAWGIPNLIIAKDTEDISTN